MQGEAEAACASGSHGSDPAFFDPRAWEQPLILSACPRRFCAHCGGSNRLRAGDELGTLFDLLFSNAGSDLGDASLAHTLRL